MQEGHLNIIPIGSNVNVYVQRWETAYLGFPIGIKNRNFVEDLPIDHSWAVWYSTDTNMVVREEAFWNIFPIGSNVKLSPAVSRHFEFSYRENV